MLLGDLIYQFRTEHNLSLRGFANKCGLSYTYISMLERNKDYRTGKPIVPSLDSVKYIAKAMNLSVDELLKIIDDEQEFNMKDNAPTVDQNYYMCPTYGRISAGQPNWSEECLDGYLPIDSNLMNIVNPEECFFLKVDGESMNKIIKNGAYALIRKQDTVEDGEIAVVLVDGLEATLKKFTKQGEFIILEPMSNDNNIKAQVYDQNTSIKILGKYIGKFELNY